MVMHDHIKAIAEAVKAKDKKTAEYHLHLLEMVGMDRYTACVLVKEYIRNPKEFETEE